MLSLDWGTDAVLSLDWGTGAVLSLDGGDRSSVFTGLGGTGTVLSPLANSVSIQNYNSSDGSHGLLVNETNEKSAFCV